MGLFSGKYGNCPKCRGRFELAMTDASGNEVSNVVKAHADMSDADDTARVTRSQFSLKAGCQYSSKSAYYLVCREKDTK